MRWTRLVALPFLLAAATAAADPPDAAPEPALDDAVDSAAAPDQPAGETDGMAGPDDVAPPGGDTDPGAVRPWRAGTSETQRQQALAAYERGNQFFERQQYSQALVEYRAAVATWDHPAIRYNAAVCLIHLDRPLEALDNLERGMRFGVAPLGDALYAQGRTYQKLLRGRLSELTVSCRQPGATVTINGGRPLQCPDQQTLLLEPGRAQLVARKAGFSTATRDVDLAPGKQVAVSLDPVAVEDVALERRWPVSVPWLVAGGGTAAGLLSIPLFVSANRDIAAYDVLIDDLSDGQPVDPSGEPQALLDSADRKRVAAAGLVVIGASTAVAGVVMAFLNQPRRPEAPALSVVPGDGGATVSVRLRF